MYRYYQERLYFVNSIIKVINESRCHQVKMIKMSPVDAKKVKVDRYSQISTLTFLAGIR